MSLNDKDITLAGPQGTDVYNGVANPAPFGNGNPYKANFVSENRSYPAGLLFHNWDFCSSYRVGPKSDVRRSRRWSRPRLPRRAGC